MASSHMLKFLTLTLFALLLSVDARKGPYGDDSHNSRPSPSPFGGYILPLGHGNQSLPAPAANLTLKYLALTRGTYNYSCATSDNTSTPFAIGPFATIYNASQIIPFLHNESEFHSLPAILVDLPLVFLNMAFQVIGNITQPAPHRGYFDLRPEALFVGTLNKQIPAPPNAAPGPDGSAAIPWFELTALPGSYGLEQVYRVETAGGSAPPTCAGLASLFQVPFAAESWMYG